MSEPKGIFKTQSQVVQNFHQVQNQKKVPQHNTTYFNNSYLRKLANGKQENPKPRGPPSHSGSSGDTEIIPK